MSKKTYYEKLKDPRWQKMRLEVMERDGFQCRNCRSKENTLNVHHSHYRRDADPWDYELGHLITLCEGCHKLVEARREVILQDTVNPLVQLQVMQFAALLVDKPGPFSAFFMAALESMHSMMAAEEAIKELTNEYLSTGEPIPTLKQWREQFEGSLLDLHQALFGIRQDLLEIDSSAGMGMKHPILETLYPSPKG